jgi:hypothetical protein
VTVSFWEGRGSSPGHCKRNVLLVQLKELLLAHGLTLHKLINESLKSLLSPEGMQDLEEFAAAKEVPYRTRGVIVQPSAGPSGHRFRSQLPPLQKVSWLNSPCKQREGRPIIMAPSPDGAY